MILTIGIVGRGVTKGLETAIRWFMPLLFLLLIALLIYSFNSGACGIWRSCSTKVGRGDRRFLVNCWAAFSL